MVQFVFVTILTSHTKLLTPYNHHTIIFCEVPIKLIFHLPLKVVYFLKIIHHHTKFQDHRVVLTSQVHMATMFV